MKRDKRKAVLRRRRHRRVRTKVEGTAERPRLCVFRSGKHIYVQVIDDWAQRTLLSCSSLSPELRAESVRGSSVEGAAKVGESIARKCVESGITALVFDRGGYKYHGRVKALAEAARSLLAKAGGQAF
jgi:large subunit ribosomal protein L18